MPGVEGSEEASSQGYFNNSNSASTDEDVFVPENVDLERISQTERNETKEALRQANNVLNPEEKQEEKEELKEEKKETSEGGDFGGNTDEGKDTDNRSDKPVIENNITSEQLTENEWLINIALEQIKMAYAEERPLDGSFIEDTSSIVYQKWAESKAGALPKGQSKRFSGLKDAEKAKFRAVVSKAIEIFDNKKIII